MVHFADLQNSKTAYELTGHGRPILLIHGAEADRHSFRALANALSDSATVITYDQRDCGDTFNHAGTSSLIDLAHDAAQLIRWIGLGPVAVMGTSLGGRVAQVLALLYPAQVLDLMLCNTWPLPLQLSALNPEGHAKLRALAGELPASAQALAAMFYSAAFLDANTAVIERFAKRSANAFRSARQAIALETFPVAVRQITSRSLLISGSADRIVPSTVMRDMHTFFANASFVELPGVGHSAAVEAPEKLAHEIRAFLR